MHVVSHVHLCPLHAFRRETRSRAATKALQSCENAHKHTTAELQRTRSTLHALRATHQTEIKKIEKEKERMVER